MSRTTPSHAAAIECATAALRVAEIARAAPEVEHQVLRLLPKAMGYESAADFLWAFRTANGLSDGHTILTPRKMKELIKRSVAGEGRREIAAKLGCSPQTVSNVRVKLGLSSRMLQRS
jgi:DNA-binding NarL/FixJ family response regulator